MCACVCGSMCVRARASVCISVVPVVAGRRRLALPTEDQLRATGPLFRAWPPDHLRSFIRKYAAFLGPPPNSLYRLAPVSPQKNSQFSSPNIFLPFSCFIQFSASSCLAEYSSPQAVPGRVPVRGVRLPPRGPLPRPLHPRRRGGRRRDQALTTTQSVSQRLRFFWRPCGCGFHSDRLKASQKFGPGTLVGVWLQSGSPTARPSGGARPTVRGGLGLGSHLLFQAVTWP